MATQNPLRRLTVTLIVGAIVAPALLQVAAPANPPADVGSTVSGFQDEFTGSVLAAGWSVKGANVYSLNSGHLHIGQASGDPNHLLYATSGYSSTVQEVLVRLRVTRFGNGPYARGGISVAVDAASSQGINFSFRDNDGAGHPGRHLELLDDYREWGPVLNFVWQTNTWYWMRLRQEPNAASGGGVNDVFAKIWLGDGSVAEPAGWQLSWNYNASRSTRAGLAGLMAGSTAGGVTDFSEFDVDYFLIKATGLPSVVIAPTGFLQIPVTITNAPQSQTVAELAPATFTVGASGSPPPTYQWYRNDGAISGATNLTYRLANATLDDEGALFKVVAANLVSNITYSVTSSPVSLTVVADIMAPALVTARSLGLGLVQVVFSEPVALTTATNLEHYSLRGPGGNVGIVHATLEAAKSNVRIAVSPALTEHAVYTLSVNGVTDQAAAANRMVPASVDFTALAPTVRITEFVAENTGGLVDVDGEHSDWIELQNQSPFPIELDGWRLTDTPAMLMRWVFPATELAPGGFLVVFATGRDRRVPGAELHTNFRLDGNGEYLALLRPDGSIADQISFGPQREDTSFGLSGATNLFMLTPTPGATNGPGVFGFVADTKFEPSRGFFSNSFTLTITTATAQAEIWFTTDGTVPTPGAAGSSRYTAPVMLSNTATVRGRAFLAGYAPTDVDTHTYLSVATAAKQPANPPGFPSAWCSPGAGGCFTADYGVDPQVVTNAAPGYDFTNALLALPAVSLVAPRDDWFGATRGIYYDSFSQGDAFEREASIELIFPDGRAGFQYEAGVRIHGYTSRSHGMTLKHSLRVAFRDRYGPAKLHFPLFPDTAQTDFDQLVLRACSTDSYPIVEGGARWEARRATYLRDQWMRDALRDLGQPTAHGRYVHLWINGLYWGVYNLTEALGTGWAAEHLGGAKDDYDVIKDYLLVDHGDQQAWDAATALASAGFATETAYQRVQGCNPDGTRNTNYPVYLSISNLVDYMIVHITAGAEDWDFNNWWGCRRRGPESSGFRFCAWDQEISNESLTRVLNVFGQRFEEVNTVDRPSYFYDRLRNTSPSFRQFFRDRLWQVFSDDGPLAATNNAVRWLTRQNEIDRAIVAESARWGDARREPPFTRDANWLPEMRWVANYWSSNQTRVTERFRRVSLWPLLAPPVTDRSNAYFTTSFSLTLTHTNATGGVWFTLDGSDPRAASGAPAANAQRYVAPLTISGPTRLRARVSDNVNWSPPASASFYPLQSLTNLVVNEIYFNPPGAPGLDGDDFEFIELRNAGPDPLDLTGLAFSAGIQFVFTNGPVLASEGYLVLARSLAGFKARFPDVTPYGLYAGRLANEGETLALAHPLGTAGFSLTYNDRMPWPRSADGAGDSLHRLRLGDPNDAANWCATSPTPGAPAPPACRDTDSDGLPDTWELVHGFDPDDPVDDDGGSGDPDGDGVTNVEEYLAGTDPWDAGSYLRIENLSVGPSVRLTFLAAANRFYSVQYTIEPGGGSWATFYEVPAQPVQRLEIVEDPVVQPKRFYRLVTSR